MGSRKAADGKSEPRSGNGITAGELIAELEERRRTDPVYRAQLEAVEAEREKRVRALRAAEEPIVKDLRDAGYDVNSVWDLGNKPVPYPAAFPVLLEHLRRGGYPDRVMESLGQALAVRAMAPEWEVIKALYLGARSPGEETGLAVALAGSATRDHLDELVALLREESRGATRIYFLRPIKRLGGDRGRALLESLVDDPLFGREARALLKTRRR